MSSAWPSTVTPGKPSPRRWNVSARSSITATSQPPAASRSATADPTRPQPTTTACFPFPAMHPACAERSAGAGARPLSSRPVTSEPLGIGLLGYGTVGSAVDRLLRERADVVERVAGRPVRVVRALVRDATRAREGAAPGLLTDRFEDIRDDPSIKVVAEVMGGVEPTLGYLRELLERGVSVVSANKQLLARHGAELQAGRRPRRGAAALRGLGLRGHPRRARAAGVARRGRRRRADRDRQRHDQLHAHRHGARRAQLCGCPRRGPGARLRRGRSERGRRRRRRGRQARHPGLARVPPPPAHRRCAVRGHRHAARRRRRVRERARLRGQAAGPRASLGRGHRSQRGSRARAARASAGARQRQLQRGHAARPRDPRDHAAGARRRRRRDGHGRDRRPALGARAAARRRGRARRSASCRSSRRAAPAARSTSTSRSPTGPACWPASPRASAIAASRSAR